MKRANLSGEYPVSVDAKGRVMMPATLQRMLPKESKNRMVINRGFEKCLVIYPQTEWEIIEQEVSKLNLYVKDNRDFARYFFRGLTHFELDGNNRFLLPKSLLDYAEIKKDAVLFAFTNRIEVWSEELSLKQMDEEPVNYAQLAEEVMGNIAQKLNWN